MNLNIFSIYIKESLLRLLFIHFFQTDGRLLPPEKIKFGSTAITSNAQADFGREAVKEAVITPVRLSEYKTKV